MLTGEIRGGQQETSTGTLNPCQARLMPLTRNAQDSPAIRAIEE